MSERLESSNSPLAASGGDCIFVGQCRHVLLEDKRVIFRLSIGPRCVCHILTVAKRLLSNILTPVVLRRPSSAALL